ncbi:MAG: tryptophan-rich sensory protein, partial [Cyanobacteria bacterium P01_A01_bin.105]
GWGGWGLGDMGWTVIMVLVSAVIGGTVVWTHRDWTFLGVFLWAYAAIAARHAETPTLWVTALIASLGLIGLLITRYRLKG